MDDDRTEHHLSRHKDNISSARRYVILKWPFVLVLKGRSLLCNFISLFRFTIYIHGLLCSDFLSVAVHPSSIHRSGSRGVQMTREAVIG